MNALRNTFELLIVRRLVLAVVLAIVLAIVLAVARETKVENRRIS